MKYVPKALTRTVSRSLLKLQKHSPTLLVVGGVAGLSATVVLAAVATRKIEPVLNEHAHDADQIREDVPTSDQGREMLRLYTKTTMQFTKIYGPAITLGVVSAGSVLWGHNILKGRHVATMLAYSGLQDQFGAYRDRIKQTLGEEAERDIYAGAHGENGPDGLAPVWPEEDKSPLNQTHYLRPWFAEHNRQWTKSSVDNYLWLKGVQHHANSKLNARGHLFLNEVLDDLDMERVPEGQVSGWILNGDGDDYVDFGFMTGNDAHTVAFRNQAENTVQLNFNVDGLIWDKI